MVDRVLLDVDGVLIKNPYRKSVFPEVARKLVEEDKVQEFVEMMMEESVRRTREGKLVSAYDWDDIVRAVCVKMGIKGRASVTQVIEACSSIEIEPYPDAIPTLQELKRMKIEIYALTNGFSRLVTPVLKRVGIFEFLDEIITPDRVGAAKPSPEIFMVAAEGSTDPIFVGDNVSVDICGANAANITSALLWRDLRMELADPRERAIRAASLGLIQEKLRGERTSFLAPPCGCFPEFLILNLKELLKILRKNRKVMGTF